MKRMLANLAAAMSLLLCAATIAIWIRSYWVGDQLHRSRWTIVALLDGTQQMHSFEIFFVASRGGFLIESRVQDAHWTQHDSMLPAGVSVERSWTTHPPKELEYTDLRVPWWRLGFGYHVANYGRGYVATNHDLWFPAWSVALIFAVLPAVRIIRGRRRRRRSKENRCLNCGYDLRATPDRCPECGTIVANPLANAHNSS
jgi:hypothetical protein